MVSASFAVQVFSVQQNGYSCRVGSGRRRGLGGKIASTAMCRFVCAGARAAVQLSMMRVCVCVTSKGQHRWASTCAAGRGTPRATSFIGAHSQSLQLVSGDASRAGSWTMHLKSPACQRLSKGLGKATNVCVFRFPRSFVAFKGRTQESTVQNLHTARASITFQIRKSTRWR